MRSRVETLNQMSFSRVIKWQIHLQISDYFVCWWEFVCLKDVETQEIRDIKNAREHGQDPIPYVIGWYDYRKN